MALPPWHGDYLELPLTQIVVFYTVYFVQQKRQTCLSISLRQDRILMAYEGSRDQKHSGLARGRKKTARML